MVQPSYSVELFKKYYEQVSLMIGDNVRKVRKIRILSGYYACLLNVKKNWG